MKSFSTSAVIHASKKLVWSILTDASSWTDWNTTVDRVDGQIALGEKITVHAKLSPGRAFPLKVSDFVPCERMVWTGGMPFGLFKGERIYTLTDRPDRSVQFTMSEGFSGLLAPLVTRSIPNLQPSFDEFASALKKCAEGQGERPSRGS